MEASESVMTTDLNGKPIKVGTTVRYITTRTVGKVIDIKKEEDKTWAQIDTTSLYYDPHYLEVTTQAKSAEEEEESVKIDYEELEQKIKAMEDALSVKDIMTDSSCEGGG
ncbi:DUF2098 domain-containing protein [Methanocella sp. CWC-04]|uniref:DUF2098 domain-containing protein n=1 Tax=Methanooceanicella nereidis TaxID=2052831 RepID=A0AAP2RF50_9EURY|nr:DUF2098 domain-containing protein [Methanocella sp. CWC-04]MCD1296183.1 DUF2098 domain-containing protein [Methanocella sp. CWC-04]